MFSTLFTVVSMYFSFRWLLCHFSVAQRVPLKSHEHTIYQIINTKHVSKPAISFPNHIFKVDKEIVGVFLVVFFCCCFFFFPKISVTQDFRVWFCTTVEDKHVKTQDCYMQHQNRMRTISSPPVLFSPYFLFFSDSLFICADFFLVEISVEPTLTPTLFENVITFLLLRESSLEPQCDWWIWAGTGGKEKKNIWENKKAQEIAWQFSL